MSDSPNVAHGRKVTVPRDWIGFRLRGAEVTRLESFSDAVFGFALTLLVVSLEVPKSVGDLMTTMRGFPAFALCFLFLGLLWNGHYKFCGDAASVPPQYPSGTPSQGLAVVEEGDGLPAVMA